MHCGQTQAAQHLCHIVIAHTHCIDCTVFAHTQLNTSIKTLLATKEERWAALRKDCVERMDELASAFGGTKELTRIRKDERLEQWFRTLESAIQGLDHNESTLAGVLSFSLPAVFSFKTNFYPAEVDTGNSSPGVCLY